MNCHWNGKSVLDATAVSPAYYLVIFPLKEISPDLQHKISDAVKIDFIDVKTRARAEGFFVLTKSEASDDLKKKAQKLAAIGVKSAILNDTGIYAVPEQEPVHSGVSEPGKITLRRTEDSEPFVITGGNRLLIIDARIEMIELQQTEMFKKLANTAMSATNRIVGAGITGLGFSSVIARNTIVEKIPVLDIYNLDNKQSARVIAGMFNFRELLGGKFQTAQTGNFIQFATLLSETGAIVAADRAFSRSSLPYGTAIRSSHEKNESGHFIHTITLQKNEFDRFDHFSRFRYILETFPLVSFGN